MERGDFGLILQAAATGSFDFTNVGPMYYTRLRLILNELRRLNTAQVAAHSALHCVISTIGADNDSSEENYRRLQKNRNLFKRMLNIEVDDSDDTTIQQRLIDDWKRTFGHNATTEESTGDNKE